MNIDDNKHIDVCPSKSVKQVVQQNSNAEQPPPSAVPQVPSEIRLEHLPLRETTLAMMQAIRRKPVERLHEYFERTCDWRQKEVAVVYGLSQLSYENLDKIANCLAHFLISQGVGDGMQVGILLDSSLESYIAILGVLKAGAAFVPLDPSFSADQIAFIARDAWLQMIVTTSTLWEKIQSHPCPVLELDQIHEALSIQPKTRPSICVDPASLCYIIYTVDDSGQLQGVVVSHANIVNFLRVVTPIYGVRRNDRVYQGMPISSPLSFQEIWLTWIAGATLVAAPANSQHFHYGITEFLITHKISVFCCVVAQLAYIERDVPSLRLLLIGGGGCPIELVNRWASPGRRMLAMYGSAETTVAATWCELFPGRPLTIGSPLPTYQIYLLDEQFCPVVDGERGEIYIGGPGVAIGYLNRPALTRECFIPNPVERDRETVPLLYRTGDFGRITPAGEIEYLGRVDEQVTRRQPIAQVNQVSLNEAVSIPQFEAPLEARAGMLGRINVNKLYKLILTDPLYRNSIFNMASTFIMGGLGFLFWILIARMYKTEDVGIATALISIMTLLSSITILGLNVSLNRYLPRSVHKNELINSSFVVVLIVTILTSMVFLLGLQVFSPHLVFLQSNILYSILFTIFLLFSSWNILVDSVLMAFRSSINVFVKNSIISILKLILPFALVSFEAYGIFTANYLAFAIGVLVSLIILRLNFKIKPSLSINISLLKETTAYSFANYIAAFMSTMPSLVMPIIILNVLSAKYVAYYYVASMIQSILQVVPLATAQALLTEGSYNEVELKKHIKKATVTIFVVLIPITVITILFGNVVLQFMGKNYATEGFQFLQLYSGSTLFTAIIIIANAIMKVKYQMKLLIITNSAANILTLCLSYIFISNKLAGVGWGWVLGQLIASIAALYYIRQQLYK